MSTKLYVAMSEIYDDYTCYGHDLYMSLDKDTVELWLNNQLRDDSEIDWLENNEMYFKPLGQYGWEKYYIDERPLEEEL